MVTLDTNIVHVMLHDMNKHGNDDQRTFNCIVKDKYQSYVVLASSSSNETSTTTGIGDNDDDDKPMVIATRAVNTNLRVTVLPYQQVLRRCDDQNMMKRLTQTTTSTSSLPSLVDTNVTVAHCFTAKNAASKMQTFEKLHLLPRSGNDNDFVTYDWSSKGSR